MLLCLAHILTHADQKQTANSERRARRTSKSSNYLAAAAAVLSASAPYTSNTMKTPAGCRDRRPRVRRDVRALPLASATLTMIWDCARCRVFSVMTRGSSQFTRRAGVYWLS